MAHFGAKFPCFAKIATEPAGALPTYEEGVILGKLIAANLTVNLASGELWADDELAEQLSEFASGTIALETDDLEDEKASAMYGASVIENKVTYNKGDTPPLGGYAFYKTLMRNGTKIFKGYFYPKVRAALGSDNAQTRTSSITFGTTSTTLTVMTAGTGDWRITEQFDTEQEAIAWVKEQMNMDQAAG